MKANIQSDKLTSNRIRKCRSTTCRFRSLCPTPLLASLALSLALACISRSLPRTCLLSGIPAAQQIQNKYNLRASLPTKRIYMRPPPHTHPRQLLGSVCPKGTLPLHLITSILSTNPSKNFPVSMTTSTFSPMARSGSLSPLLPLVKRKSRRQHQRRNKMPATRSTRT